MCCCKAMHILSQGDNNTLFRHHKRKKYRDKIHSFCRFKNNNIGHFGFDHSTPSILVSHIYVYVHMQEHILSFKRWI